MHLSYPLKKPLIQNDANEMSEKSSYSYIDGLVCVVGIYISFLAFGMCQEKIFKVGNQEANDTFVYSNFLIWLLVVNNVIWSGFAIYLQSGGNFSLILKKRDSQVLKLILYASISYITSLICTNYALTHVNFPTQVLVKSGKMVLVVSGGFIVFGKRYPWYDYASIFLVTASLVIFNLAKGGGKSGSAQHQTSMGLFFLFVALVCDGVTGPIQDKANSRGKLSSVEMMFFLNLFAAVWCTVSVSVMEGVNPIYFCQRYPESFLYLAGFAMTGTVGQFFIFMSLKKFGSLYTSLFTTLRKAASTLLSVYWFNHQLSSFQWAAVACMFLTLASHTLLSHFMKKRKSA